MPCASIASPPVRSRSWSCPWPSAAPVSLLQTLFVFAVLGMHCLLQTLHDRKEVPWAIIASSPVRSRSWTCPWPSAAPVSLLQTLFVLQCWACTASCRHCLTGKKYPGLPARW